ncbi:hypothetical protein HYFRA_00006950 [Hymenoscyphus fraxineus]|uniref:NAD(P)-binding protein n=1 Tax=Hymenoscyphus fraxineus TaxID=746836 RepID=A0A9N9KN91_9HELO|nr:hypothetical protein HYFRA_00006950 [Hymenoscyphus fraxineus]
MSATKSLVWLITGSSSGFGKSLTLHALRAGHKVIATSRTPSGVPKLVEEVEELGGIYLQLDVTSPKEELQKIVEQGVRDFGRIDVLVNCAGIGILGALEDVNEQECQNIMATNVFGPLNLIQIILPYMRSQKSGTIVNISSGSGIDPRPSMGLYGASKFALEGLSQGLAKEVSCFGIRILIVQPGAFTTRMMDSVTLTAKRSKAYDGTDVGQWMAKFDPDSPEGKSFKAPHDVEKGAAAILEVVTGTGRGEGKLEHLRLLLSREVAEGTKKRVEGIMADREAFRDIWENTAHDGGVLKAFEDL